MNRSVSPQVEPILKVNLPAPVKTELANGVPVYSFDLADQDLVKIEVVFNTGTAHQNKPLVAEFCSKLLREGTTSKNAQEIADEIDYFGSFFEHSVNKDFSSFTLYCLTKYAKESLDIFSEVLLKPSFPQKEFEIIKRNERQKFQVNSDKVSTLCRREFAKKLHNSSHPYHSTVSIDSFDIEINEVKNYYNSKLSFLDAQIFVSGKVNADLIGQIDAVFGHVSTVKNALEPVEDVLSSNPGNFKVEKTGAIQSAIRIGKILDIKRSDPDYVPFAVLNTALGGYFSSRLMANIREDKGFTYGIGSGLIANLHATTFLISTEVNAESTEATLTEIRKEIERLRAELMPEEELSRVKSYMVGSFLRNSDGPFDVCERFKSTQLFGMEYSFYDSYLEKIQGVTSEKLMEVAQRYLALDSMIEVVAGP